MKPNFTIKTVTRGHIVCEFDGKRATIPGEALLPGHPSPDFVIFERMLTKWDPPHDGVPMDEPTKRRLLALVVSEMRKSGTDVQID